MNRVIAPDRRRWLALGLLSITQFMLIADQTVVNIALPSIGDDLGITGVGLSWVVNAYVLTFGGLLLLAGRASDLFGRRRMFVVGLLLFAASSLAGGFAADEAMIVAARAVQGVGAAVLSASALAAMFGTFPAGPERNRALGIWAAAAGSGGAVGVLLGGLLTDGPGWPWVFWINVPIGVLGAAMAPYVLTEARAAVSRRLDLWGSVTGTAGMTLLIYTFTQAEHAGWGSAQTLGLLAGALALLAGFVVIERRSPEPLLPFRIFAIRALSVANAAMVLFAAGIFAMMFFLSLHLQNVLGYTPLEAGLAYIPLAMGLFFGPIGGRLLTLLGPRTTMLTGLVLAGAGMLWFTRLSVDGSFLVNVLGPSLLIAAGGQFAVVGMTTSALTGVSERDQGIASGVFNTSREIGGAFGIGVLAALAASRTDAVTATAGSEAAALSEAALSEGYRAGVLGAALFVVGALAVAAIFTPRTGGAAGRTDRATADTSNRTE